MPQKKPRKNERGLGKFVYNSLFSNKQYNYQKKKVNVPAHSKLQESEMERIQFNQRTNILNTNGNDDSEGPDEEELARIENIKNYQNLLAIPKRPLNAKNMTKDELSKSEEENYGAWRRNIEQLSTDKRIRMTPFEVNLHFWRQLWRVIERSDILIQVVDARNPLVFRNRDLETYVKEVDANKLNVILINKSDYLTESQRKIWAEYFNEQNIRVIFWSATAVSEKKNESEETINKIESTTKELQLNEHSDNEDSNSDCDKNKFRGSTNNEDNSDDQTSDGDNSESKGSTNNEDNSDDQTSDVDNSKSKGSTNNEDIKEHKSIEQKQSNNLSDENQIKNSHLIVGVSELIRMLETMTLSSHVEENKVVVGLIGYPNVGKSSTVNAIYGSKKTSVSATPGRTKRFQTLIISDKLTFCDCPGLVMPSIVNSRAELALSGILDLNTLKDFVTPMNLVATQFPRSTFEALYGISIITPQRNEDQNRPPTGRELLSAYSFMHSMVGSKGNPNLDKAARIMLKDYVAGKLLYCYPPPNYNPDEFGSAADIPIEKQMKYLKRKKNITDTNVEEPFVPFTASNVEQSRSQVSYCVKPNSYRIAIKNDKFNPDEAELKPWRNQGKRVKKEKARNKYKHLDQQPYIAD